MHAKYPDSKVILEAALYPVIFCYICVSDDSNSNMVIYIVAVYTVLGLVLLIVSALFGLYFYRHR